MKNPWLHRSAILLAVLTLIAIILGALLTSEIRPLPGTTAPVTVNTAPGLEQTHRIAGYIVAILTLGVAIRFSKMPGWIALGAAGLEGFLGGIPTVHALLAPVVFSLIAAIMVMTSNEWQGTPQLVKSDWKRLLPLGTAVPVLLVLQVALGAAFRHNAMGVLWHIVNGLVVLAAILVTGIFVLRQYPEHPSLRPAALALLIITGVQVLLGFTVYMVLLISAENNIGLIITGVIHVANGSLTLAASVALAMQMHRNIDVTDRSVT
jgi:heme A synthase